MDKKIIVAGGGHGGIACAALLAKAGYDVTVYEQHSREEMGYDWTDIFNGNSLADAGIPMPEKDKCQPIYNMCFIPPSDEMVVRQEDDEARGNDLKMERRDIYDLLISHAEQAGVRFEYETKILAPIMAGDRVIGIKTDKGEFLGDLVLDACGCNSPVRSQLPACCGIQADAAQFEKFYVYRAFYNHTDAVAKDKYKVYMLPKDVFGIAWVADDDDYSDILIGQFNPLTVEEAEKKTEAFRQKNPILGTERLRGGQLTVIPVRQTLSIMVADGYAAIGDSAFMTIPIIGSGIANSLRAGKILADVIQADETQTFSAETLWDYQLRYYNEIGAKLSPYALVKLLLTKITPEQLDYMFKSQILTINELSLTDEGQGGLIDINPELLKKGKAMVKDKKLTALVIRLGADIARLTAVNKAIPRHYSRYGVQAWAKRYDAIFKTE